MIPVAIHTYDNFPKMFNIFIWQIIQKCQRFLRHSVYAWKDGLATVT